MLWELSLLRDGWGGGDGGIISGVCRVGQGLGTHTGAQGVRTSLMVVVAAASSSSVAAAFSFTCRPRESSFSSSYSSRDFVRRLVEVVAAIS